MIWFNLLSDKITDTRFNLLSIAITIRN